MARPTFKAVFEEDESDIRSRILVNPALDSWRKEPGDFVYDTVATCPPEIKQLEINQDFILKNSFAQYAEDEFLDYKLYEKGLTRGAATPNRRNIAVEAEIGVRIPSGYVFSVIVHDQDGNPYEFTVDETVNYLTAGSQTVALTCKTKGVDTNVPAGTQFIAKPPVPGIKTITDLGTTIPGTDKESDESAWARYDFALSNPDTGGNKNDYVRWVMDMKDQNNVNIVGKARCLPRWDGVNTVKVILVGNDFLPASNDVVAEVQEYLDPGIQGLGEGKAPCGAVVTVSSADGILINISATVTYSQGYNGETVLPKFEDAVKTYLKSLVFTDDAVTGGPAAVMYNQIFALLTFTEGVNNFSNLLINDGNSDIVMTTTSIPVLGTVTI